MNSITEESPRILVVDDDAIILIALKEIIQSQGCIVDTANSPDEALELLDCESYYVIISDHRMPDMTGLEFFAKAKVIQPDATRILITGVLKLNIVIDAINTGEIFRFIAKPWVREEFMATLQNAIQRYQLIKSNQRLQKESLELNESLTASNAELGQALSQMKNSEVLLEKSQDALRRNFKQSLNLCYQIIATFHPLIAEHTKFAMKVCDLICQRSTYTQKEQEILKTSAVLYNIGLISLPREVYVDYIKNPEGLSEEHKFLAFQHPSCGQILASFVDELEEVSSVIRSHREKWDGSGYPDKLAEEAIPKLSRMLHVVVRYVESSKSKEDILDEILSLSGNEFDPDAVALFLKVTRSARLPKKVKEVDFENICEGMILAKGIYSSAGLLLVQEGQLLNSVIVDKIKKHNIAYPLSQQVLVYS